MSNFADFLAQDRRLAILELLVQARGEASETVIERALNALGHRVGVDRDVVREEFTFLETVGCVKTEWVGDRVQVAKITKRGVAVAHGKITVEGVAEPSMGV